jgi:hypothetical protein
VVGDQTSRPPVAPEFHRVAEAQRSRTRNLSRAVAGMALAIIVAVTAVAAELSLDLWSRHTIYGRRLAQARQRLDEINLADQRAIALIDTARSQFELDQDRDALMLAPDLQLIRIIGLPPACNGVVLLSPVLDRALLTITGLSALSPGRHYQLESLDQRGIAHPIAGFQAAAEPALVALPPATVTIQGRRLTINASLP